MHKIITIKNLNKTFITEKSGDIEALENINLSINENEFVCIVGPSGCGKSTLLRIISGLDKQTSGKIEFNREIIKNKRDIGMVFQEYSLYPWRTVIDNISIGLEFSGVPKKERLKLSREYLDKVDLLEFEDSYPYELSGGMQQRVSMARALVNNPQLLLMDEPLGALDAYTRLSLQKEILKLFIDSRKTVLFVTHSIDEAVYLADRIVIMSKRPGTIKEVINVEIERPRDRISEDFIKTTSKVLSILDEEHSIV